MFCRRHFFAGILCVFQEKVTKAERKLSGRCRRRINQRLLRWYKVVGEAIGFPQKPTFCCGKIISSPTLTASSHTVLRRNGQEPFPMGLQKIFSKNRFEVLTCDTICVILSPSQDVTEAADENGRFYLNNHTTICGTKRKNEEYTRRSVDKRG